MHLRTSLLMLVVGCGAADRTAAAPPSVDAAPGPPPAAVDPRFAAVIQSTALEYAAWGRVDETPSMASLLCRAPIYPQDYGKPAQVRRSEADGAPHSRKLFYIFATDKDQYARLGDYLRGGPLATRTSVVKESWSAEPGKGPEAARHPLQGPPTPTAWLETSDGPLHTGERLDLYVMTKLAPDTPGTDEGWIYGTVSPDGAVTSAGLVERCMSCHQRAPHERLFGL